MNLINFVSMVSFRPKLAAAILPVLFSLVITTHAQDSLPNFTVQVNNGAIIIGWINPYNDIAQLIIQQSKDSIGGFRSIVTMPDPGAITNGFAYKKPNSENYFYRIFLKVLLQILSHKVAFIIANLNFAYHKLVAIKFPF
jgi:hypothetical protein